MRAVIASLNPAIERLLVVERNRPGRVHRLRESHTLAGGKGVNVARVLAQLAAADPALLPGRLDAELTGPLGGPTGDLHRALSEAESLKGTYVPVSEWTRINEVLVDESAPELATVYNAAGPMIDRGEVEVLRRVFAERVRGAAMIVCTGSLPPGVPASIYAEWIAEARTVGAQSVLDASGDALLLGAEAAPTIIKINRDELDQVAAGEPQRAVERWLDAGSTAVVVTDGAGPTRAATSQGRFEVCTPPVRLRSAVGSGDAFTAGLVRSRVLAPTEPWSEHLRLAAACGASNAASSRARLSDELPPASLLADVRITEKESWRW